MTEHQPEAPADYWERKAQPVTVAEGTTAAGRIGSNTISRAELGAYYRRLGYSRGGDAAAAVFDDITARRQPYEPAGETGAQTDPTPPVAADLEVAALQTSAGCDRLDQMVTEYANAIGAIRYALDITAPFLPAAGQGGIAAARDALRVLEGAESHEEGPARPDPGTGSSRPLASADDDAQERAGGHDGGEGEAGIRERVESLLDAPANRRPRCKACDTQVGAAMTVLGPLLERAEAAEGRLAELENAVTWETSCTSCARVLDSAYAETCRAEAAEARLATITAMARDAKASAPAGMTAIVAAERVLAAAGGDGETPRPWTAADERGRILAIAECLKSEFEVTARNSEGTRTVTVQAVPYGALRSMALLGDGPGERAGAERLRALGVTGEAQERSEDEEVRTS